MKVRLATLNEVPAECSKIASFFGMEIFMYHPTSAPRLVARTCLHLGSQSECRDGEFEYPWHGAYFDMATGQKNAGTAPQGDRLKHLTTINETYALLHVLGEA